MDLKELIMEVSNLEDRIDLIDSNLKFNITIFLGLLTLFVAMAGWALYLFAKSIVGKGLERRISTLREELNNNYETKISQLENVSISSYGENSNGQYVRYNNGIQICTLKTTLFFNSKESLSNVVVFPAAFEMVENLQATILGDKNLNVLCEDLTITYAKVKAESNNYISFSAEDTIDVFILVTGKWTNE